MHTFGMDHCVSFNCLMNSFINDCSYLCPADLRKLHSEINFDILQRDLELKNYYKKKRWKKDFKWREKKYFALIKFLNSQP